jgi:hypothetical protein
MESSGPIAFDSISEVSLIQVFVLGYLWCSFDEPEGDRWQKLYEYWIRTFLNVAQL